MNEDQEAFSAISQAAGHIVGTEETKLREQMGDPNYESYVAYVERSREANVDSVVAHSFRERMKGVWWAGAGASVLTVAGGFVAWLLR